MNGFAALSNAIKPAVADFFDVCHTKKRYRKRSAAERKIGVTASKTASVMSVDLSSLHSAVGSVIGEGDTVHGVNGPMVTLDRCSSL